MSINVFFTFLFVVTSHIRGCSYCVITDMFFAFKQQLLPTFLANCLDNRFRDARKLFHPLSVQSQSWLRPLSRLTVTVESRALTPDTRKTTCPAQRASSRHVPCDTDHVPTCPRAPPRPDLRHVPVPPSYHALPALPYGYQTPGHRIVPCGDCWV
jgi:hypothetical protein